MNNHAGILWQMKRTPIQVEDVLYEELKIGPTQTTNMFDDLIET